MNLEAIMTPRLVLDIEVAKANIERMANLIIKQYRKKLRPHFKTSKMIEIAKLQQLYGACGLTCATAAEVRSLIERGFRDLYWAHIPVGEQRIAATLEFNRQASVAVALDSLAAAQPLAAAATSSGQQIPYLIEINSGLGRAGVSGSEQALRLAYQLRSFRSLRCKGIFTHEGHLYAIKDPEERHQAGQAVGQHMNDIATALRQAGFEIATVSVGSTPAAASAPQVDGITEARPGTYVFADRNQVSLQVASPQDCAVKVVSRVVSRPRAGIAIIDAGLKAMSSDRALADQAFGGVSGYEQVEFLSAYEEHGVLSGAGVAELEVGQLVSIVPNHVCGTVNMWSSALILHQRQIIDEWSTVARH